MLKAGICLCTTIIVIITAGGATAIDTARKLRPSQASVSSANQPWRKVAFDYFQRLCPALTYQLRQLCDVGGDAPGLSRVRQIRGDT
jgi:hypothetical protein